MALLNARFSVGHKLDIAINLYGYEQLIERFYTMSPLDCTDGAGLMRRFQYRRIYVTLLCGHFAVMHRSNRKKPFCAKSMRTTTSKNVPVGALIMVSGNRLSK